ncbi:MAG: universal stress protein [Saprospiraceae bacterium]
MNSNNHHNDATHTFTALQPFLCEAGISGFGNETDRRATVAVYAFLADILPVEAIAFVHQLPSYALFSHLFTEQQALASQQEARKAQLLQQMDEKINRNFTAPSHISLSHVVRIGDPLTGLLGYAKELDADLMLIGQKKGEGGHGILPRKLAGMLSSNALIIPQNSRLSMQKILVPVDFSPHSQKALEVALQIGLQLKGSPEIVCLHLFDMPEFAVSKSYQTLVREEKEKELSAFIAPYNNHYSNLRVVLQEKEIITRAGLYILDYALEIQADMIAVGARGLSPIDALIVGSVTERLLSVNDDIPTLIVRDKKK